MNKIIDVINNSQYDFYFLVVDKFLDISLPEFHNFHSLSASKLNINIEEKNSGRLLSHPTVEEFIKSNSAKTGRKVAIIPFKPSAKIDAICIKNNWTLVSNPSHLNRTIEDKVGFYKQIADLKIPALPSLVTTFSKSSFQDSQTELNCQKLVVQTRFGWAGNSSFLTESYEDISSQIPEGSLVKITPYLTGYSLINNCCLTKKGLLQSPPGLQFTGISPLTKNPLATVGRQWPSMAPPEVQEDVRNFTSKYSEYLVTLGYKGFFGLDFFVSEGKTYLIECNPRLTASFAFYTDIEKKSGLTPMFYYHLLEFTGLIDQVEITDNDRFYNQTLVGSEITSKNDTGATINKYHDFIQFADSPHVNSLPDELISKVL